MAITIAGIVAALGVAGSAGAQIYGAAKSPSGGQRNIQTSRIPLPPSQQAFQDYILRTVAANATKQAPNFLEYVQSGGQAKFPFQDTGFTPDEARRLGFVSRQGTEVPFFDPGQSKFNLSQALYAGSGDLAAGKNTKLAKLSRAFQMSNRIGRTLEDPSLDDKKRRALENRRANALKQYDLLRRQVEGMV